MRFSCLLSALLFCACSGPGVGDAGSSRDAGFDAGDLGGPCTDFQDVVELGQIDDPMLTELSGLAASRRHADRYYAHNDSGDSARVFVLDDGAHVVGQLALTGASAHDYEDIAIGPGPDGMPWVYVGDTGDNVARDGTGTPRENVTVYMFAEPDTLDGAVTPDPITLTYPDHPHDCEAMFVDTNGDLYLITKEDDGASILFRAAAPLGASAVLEPIHTLALGDPPLGGSPYATGADLSPLGGRLLLRTYNRIHLFVREPGEPWPTTLARAPLPVTTHFEPQGESVAWLADGRGYLTAGEGVASPVYRFGATDSTCEPH
ncbi:MAG: hypothetical protein AB7S26_32550 [Sandaracinaceae bacterium]